MTAYQRLMLANLQRAFQQGTDALEKRLPAKLEKDALHCTDDPPKLEPLKAFRELLYISSA